MSEILKTLVDSQLNSVEHRHAGSWPVYADYDLVKREGEGKGQIYVVGSNFDPQQIWRYAPLREPVLFIEFAELFDRTNVSKEEAAPTVWDWVKRYGTLGANHAYGKMHSSKREWVPSDGLRLKVHGTFSAGYTLPHNVYSRYSVIDTTSGAIVWSPPHDIQSVDEFVLHSTIANRCWRLLKASKARGGPDAETLRELLRDLRGVEDEGTPAQLANLAKSLVDEFLNIYLMYETCLERYHVGDGKSVRGPGFLSLLGALYLQMSNFRDAEEITYCKSCGEVVTFEQGDPPPSDAPKGTRGKHRTHSNREYCKEKYGVKDYCKNKWNADRRKKARGS